MTTKDRLLAAIKNEEADYVPMVIEWNEDRMHEKLNWTNARERLEFHRMHGWDTHVNLHSGITPAACVNIDKSIASGAGHKRVLTQVWHTPAGNITERLRATDDWDELWEGGHPYLQMMSDFRTSRYIEYPFKSARDMEALKYIFADDNPADIARIKREHEAKRRLADEFDVPLFVYFDAGMDWLLWLFPPEEAIIRVLEEPDFIHAMLAHINEAKHRQLAQMLQLGVDGVMRRGWYESTDLWNPGIFKEFAMPALRKEIDMVHGAGAPYIYIMDTGVDPLLADLATLDFDCLLGADPVLGGHDIGRLRRMLPGKSLWGGFSGPGHFGADSPDIAAKAVESAIEACGKRGLVLGMAVSFRHYWPWANFAAAEEAWIRFR